MQDTAAISDCRVDAGLNSYCRTQTTSYLLLMLFQSALVRHVMAIHHLFLHFVDTCRYAKELNVTNSWSKRGIWLLLTLLCITVAAFVAYSLPFFSIVMVSHRDWCRCSSACTFSISLSADFGSGCCETNRWNCRSSQTGRARVVRRRCDSYTKDACGLPLLIHLRRCPCTSCDPPTCVLTPLSPCCLDVWSVVALCSIQCGAFSAVAVSNVSTCLPSSTYVFKRDQVACRSPCCSISA